MNEYEIFCLVLATFCIIMVAYFEYKINKLGEKLNDKIRGIQLGDIMRDGKLERLEDNVYALMDRNKKTEDAIKKFPGGTFKKGDRVRFKTMGGWYNGGIIKEVDDNSYLVEVDTLGSLLALEYGYIQLLPYCVRVFKSSSILEKDHDKILCDSCGTKGCVLQTGIIRSHCDFYTQKNAESEVKDGHTRPN